jgi:predicted  nucleic acid-binding Zn-ribbon protein
MEGQHQRSENNRRRSAAVVGIVIVLIAISLAIISPWTVTRPLAACDDLQLAETERSRTLLKATLTHTIATTATELEDIRSETMGTEALLAIASADLTEDQSDLEGDQAELTAGSDELADVDRRLSVAEENLKAARDAGADALVIDGLVVEVAAGNEQSRALGRLIAALNARIAGLNESIASLTATVGSTNDAVDDLVQREDLVRERFEAKYRARTALLSPMEREAEKVFIESEPQAVGDDHALLVTKIEVLDEFIDASGHRDAGESAQVFIAPRSSANLVPAVPVVKIDLGAHRYPTRVEVALESLGVGTAEEATNQSGNTDTLVASTVELPDQVEFFAEAGQLRRDEGIAIPAPQVSVWARRLGSAVMLSICVTPDGLDAGLYTGDVFLVDPSLNPTKVHIEIAAQSVFINWLYMLLLVVPAITLGYVWIKGRDTAGKNPWRMRPFLRWLKQNAVVAFVVGFAAVWATLQVPFNNRTWGSSLVNAAAVVGLGLVAAATAMTVVAGKVRGEDIDDPADQGDGEDQDREEEDSEPM